MKTHLKCLNCYFVLILILTGCNNNKCEVNNFEIPEEDGMQRIASGYDIDTQTLDAVLSVKKLTVVPLETKRESLIKDIKRIRFTDKYIFIQNSLTDVFQFDREGHFIQRIGNNGKGPGEYSTVFSFEIRDRHIIILDGYRLLFYDMKGKFHKAIETYKESKVFADDFCYFNDDKYYLWISDPVGKVPNVMNENFNDKFYHLYEVENGKIKKSHIEGVMSEVIKQRIISDGEGYLLYPTRFDHYIYRITENGISKKYQIDFAEKINLNDYRRGLTAETEDYNRDKMDRSDDFVFERNFIDNKTYCYFRFSQNRILHSTLLNKETGKSVSWRSGNKECFLDKQLPFNPSYYDQFNDCFVLDVQPFSFIEYYQSCNEWFKETSIITSETIEKLNKLDKNSNPVLFLIKI